MDANKLSVLKQVGYEVRRCCYFCRHAKFSSPSAFWGVCQRHQYRHLKHTGDLRQLSIVVFGVCYNFELNDGARGELGAFDQFLKP